MDFLKKVGLKIKVFFGVVLGLLGMVFFFFVKEKLSAKEELKYELDKVKTEIEIKKSEEETEESVKKLEELKVEEDKIREKIKIIEEREVKGQKELSLEELDKFFDERGY
jgi:Tfp pilus assembly protein PilO